jgi:GT2 family glycosyltransferase
MRQAPTPPDLTVIIASRDRRAALEELLGRLAQQETRGRFTYEVLVVDNGSTDGTRAMVERVRAGYPAPLRYAYEARPGKPRALNRGLAEARGAVLAFTDDDVLVSPGWLLALWQCLEEEQADAVAGRVLPRWTAGRPAWLTDEVCRQLGGLGCVDYGERRVRGGDGRDLRWVGGNMAVRREAVARLGGFDLRMLRGQDTEYYRRALEAGLRLVYEPAALAYHRVPAARTSPAYFRRWRDRMGFYQAYFVPWKRSHLVTIMPLWRYRMLVWLAKEWLKRAVTRRPWWERFQYELYLREAVAVWRRRVQLWPRWWLTVLTGRSHLP